MIIRRIEGLVYHEVGEKGVTRISESDTGFPGFDIFTEAEPCGEMLYSKAAFSAVYEVFYMRGEHGESA